MQRALRLHRQAVWGSHRHVGSMAQCTIGKPHKQTLQHCLPNSAQGAVCVTSFAVRADEAMIGSGPGWQPCLCHAFYQVCCILRSAVLCCC